MDYYILYIIIAFILGAILTSIAIPQILEISKKKKLFDFTGKRKSHQGAIPRLGGAVFLPNIAITLGVVMFTHCCLEPEMILHTESLLRLTLTVCSLIGLYIVGITDDLIGVRWRVKLIAQILCGVTIVAFGYPICNLYGLFGIYELPYSASVFITIFIVVLVMNAINLIDGIDGLASCIAKLALLVWGIFFFSNDFWLCAIVAFATLGVILPFSYYNLFGKEEKNRKIFMGDTGSLTLGFILSLLVIRGGADTGSNFLESKYNFIFFYSLLVVPIFDIVSVIFFRIITRKSIFKADRSHIHHRFLQLGFSHKQTMCIILSIAISFFIFNWVLASIMNINILLAINVLCWGGIYWGLIYNERKKNLQVETKFINIIEE